MVDDGRSLDHTCGLVFYPANIPNSRISLFVFEFYVLVIRHFFPVRSAFCRVSGIQLVGFFH